MDTDTIKNYTIEYFKFLETYRYGDLLPSYAINTGDDIISSDFYDAMRNNPADMKRIYKKKLSDNTILRIFSHKDADDCLAIVEYEEEKFSWKSGNNAHTLKSIFHARLPQEYVFSIILEPGEPMSICIMPQFISDDLHRNIFSSLDTTIAELEPMWTTQWFRSLFNNYLNTSSESIFTSSDENRTIYDIKQILENKGLIYDLDLEKAELGYKNLMPENGASYNKPNHKIK